MDRHGLFHKMFLISNTNKTSYTRMWAHLKDNWQSLSLSWQKASRNVPGTYLMHFSIWIHQCFHTCNAASVCQRTKKINEWQEEWMNKWNDEWLKNETMNIFVSTSLLNEWLNETMSIFVSTSLLNEWLDKWIIKWNHVWMNKWTNECMIDWMIEWTSVHDEKIAPVP